MMEIQRECTMSKMSIVKETTFMHILIFRSQKKNQRCLLQMGKTDFAENFLREKECFENSVEK